MYPNAYAGSRDYPSLGDDDALTGVETNGLRCAQCGYPIADRLKVETCPNCTSDNFEGDHLAL